uniref:Uncharacterized protein n=1 Tax=Arundo donax TaxID=35708 RepID=A0A0A8Y948_ARUDO
MGRHRYPFADSYFSFVNLCLMEMPSLDTNMRHCLNDEMLSFLC